MDLETTIKFIVNISEYSEFDEVDKLEAGIRKHWELAEQGRPEAAYFIGEILNLLTNFVRDGSDKNRLYIEIWNWYKGASVKGHAKSFFRLGQMIEDGRGLNKDLTKAVEFWLKASEMGDEEADFKLGVLYYNGSYGILEDKIKAKTYLIRSSEAGFEKAKAFLGKFYSKSL